MARKLILTTLAVYVINAILAVAIVFVVPGRYPKLETGQTILREVCSALLLISVVVDSRGKSESNPDQPGSLRDQIGS